MKVCITKEQAEGILPDKEDIHTFRNPGFGLMGADMSKEALLEKINGCDILELTGPQARGMGHGMCAYNRTAKYQGDLLFIETDEEKLVALEKNAGGPQP